MIDHVQLRVSTLLMTDVLVAKTNWVRIWTCGDYKVDCKPGIEVEVLSYPTN